LNFATDANQIRFRFDFGFFDRLDGHLFRRLMVPSINMQKYKMIFKIHGSHLNKNRFTFTSWPVSLLIPNWTLP
jgi:hypothetical protein